MTSLLQCSNNVMATASQVFCSKPLKAQVLSSFTASLHFGRKLIVDVTEFHRINFNFFFCSSSAPFFWGEKAHHEQVTEITCLSISLLP